MTIKDDKLLVSYPSRITEDEFKLLHHMITLDLIINWNGTDLRKKTFGGARFLVEDRRNPELLVADVIRGAIDKKFLVPTIHEKYKRHFLFVNPVIKNTILQEVPKEFMVGETKVEVVSYLKYSIPNEYLTSLKELDTSKNASTQFYFELLKNGIVLSHLFKVSDKYFIIKYGKIQAVKKSYVSKLLNLVDKSDSIYEYEDLESTEEQTENIEKEQNNKQTKEENDESKKEEMIDKLNIDTDKVKDIVQEALDKEKLRVEKEKERNEKLKNKIKITKKLEKDEPLLKQVVEIPSTELQYSISKFEKPITKISFKDAKDNQEKLAIMRKDYMKKVYLGDVTLQDFEDNLNTLVFDGFSNIKNTGVSFVEDNDIKKKCLDYIFPREDYNPEDFLGILVSVDNGGKNLNKYDKASPNCLLIVSMNKKLPKAKVLKNYFIAPNHHVFSEDFLQKNFSFLKFKNIRSNLILETKLFKELQLHETFDEVETKIYNTLFIDRSYKVQLELAKEHGKEKIDEVYDKAYYAMYKMYIGRISDYNKNRNRTASESYAKSFEDKKNINLKNKKVMDDNLFLKTNFKYVELDNDADLNRFKTLESDYMAIKDSLPKLPKDIDLRFRKLGNIWVGGNRGAGGCYFPYFETLCVDLDNTYSFVHEYGHAYDFLVGGVTKPLSERKDFQHIVDKYRINLLDSDSKSDNKEDSQLLAYYCDANEVFARAFETYMLDKLSFNNLMKPSLNESQYVAFDSIEDDVTEYFNNLFK